MLTLLPPPPSLLLLPVAAVTYHSPRAPLTAAAAATAGDVWALGVCLYLFIFGCTPFSGQSSYQVYEAVQKQPLAFPPSKAGSEASAEVKHLISRCVMDGNVTLLRVMMRADAPLLVLLKKHPANVHLQHTQSCLEGRLEPLHVADPHLSIQAAGKSPNLSTRTCSKRAVTCSRSL